MGAIFQAIHSVVLDILVKGRVIHYHCGTASGFKIESYFVKIDRGETEALQHGVVDRFMLHSTHQALGEDCWGMFCE